MLSKHKNPRGSQGGMLRVEGRRAKEEMEERGGEEWNGETLTCY